MEGADEELYEKFRAAMFGADPPHIPHSLLAASDKELQRRLMGKRVLAQSAGCL